MLWMTLSRSGLGYPNLYTLYWVVYISEEEFEIRADGGGRKRAATQQKRYIFIAPADSEIYTTEYSWLVDRVFH